MSRLHAFLRRQFAPSVTSGQQAFDRIFGIFLPLMCVGLDPFVFRTSFGRPLLYGYETGGIGSMLTGIASLGFWLSTRRFPMLIAGMLTGCAVFAFVLGCLLFLPSVVGLLFVIGILGFTPFATAFVFARNAVRAFIQARVRSVPGATLALVTGLATTVAGPWIAQAYIRHQRSEAILALLSENPTDDAQAIIVLKGFRAIGGLDDVVLAYGRTQNDAERERLAAAYLELTGESIEDRLYRLND